MLRETMRGVNFHEQILENYIDLDFHVLPLFGVLPHYPAPHQQECCCPLASRCGRNAGKHPLVAWKDRPAFQLDELKSLRRDHRRRHHDAEPNWAIHLGQSGVVAIDVDRHTADADGVASLAALTAKFGGLPTTATDSRGHFLFRWPAAIPMPADLKTAIKLGPGLEFLSGAHILIVAPSNHRTGDVYQWMPGLAPWEAPIVDLPRWVVDLVLVETDRKNVKPTVAAVPPGPIAPYKSVDRDGLSRRINAYLAQVPPAVSGQFGRHQTFSAAKALVHGFNLSPGEAYPYLSAYNATCLPPWDDSALRRFLDEAHEKPGPRGHLLYGGRNEIPVEWTGPPLTCGGRLPRSFGGCGHHKAQDREPAPQSDTNGNLAGGPDVSDLVIPSAIAEDMQREEAEDRAANAAVAQPPRERPQPIRCGYCKFMYHPVKNKVRVGRLACGRWCCRGHCPKKLKKIHTDNLDNRVRNHTEQRSGKIVQPRTGVVYVGTIAGDQRTWERIRKRFTRAREGGVESEFLRIQPGGTRHFLCGTIPFDGSEEMTPTDAAALVAATIAAILIFGDTRKPISTSKGWRLPEKEKSGWRGVGPLPTASREKIVKAMEAVGCDGVCPKRTPHPFMPWVVDGTPPIDQAAAAEENWGGQIRSMYEQIDLILLDQFEPIPL